MTFELYEDEFGDPRNARALSAAAEIAYLTETEGQARFQSEFGMSSRLISVKNTQAYLATSDRHILLVFRGSEGPNSIDGLKDWLMTNALNLLIVPEGPLAIDFLAAGVGAKFHQGFVMAISDIWPELFPLIQAEINANDRPLWVTGHSLGGALALLAAWLLKQKFISVHQIYTFGAPMIGNEATRTAFDREFPNKIFRYTNGPDPVPLLPMMSLMTNDFKHCGKALVVGTGAATDLIAYLQQVAGESISDLFKGEGKDRVWTGLMQKISAHFIEDYRKHIG